MRRMIFSRTALTVFFNSRGALALVLLPALSACQPVAVEDNTMTAQPDAPPATSATGLQPGEEESIKKEFRNRLSNLTNRDMFGGAPILCTLVYELGQPIIKDALLSGSTGKVRMSISITATRPVDAPPGYNPRTYLPVESCYGKPATGWVLNQPVTGTYEITIEKWQTGWRMSEHQNLVPVN